MHSMSYDGLRLPVAGAGERAAHAQAQVQVGKPALLKVRDLQVETLRAGKVTPLVRGVSFEVGRGEILGIVGESGAGKSMTGSAVSGLLEPPLRMSGGSIELDGLRIDTLPEKRMRKIRGKRIGFIFQDPSTSLNPVFTIGRQLIETIQLHHPLSTIDARARAVQLLTQVGITAPGERLDRHAHEFSGGMRQRVVIALALAGDPELVIADEPTTALDVSVQAQIMKLLKSLQRERGLSMMLVTHDIGVIAEAADRVVVMYAGRIVEAGPTQALLDQPNHPYTRGLITSVPQIGSRLRRLPQIEGSMPRPDAIGDGCAFADRCPSVMQRCRSTQPPLLERAGRETACWLCNEAER
ncbi:peptide/nickel transport system ATP-binding protein [Caballeronia udeis]|uniref:Peptide/nickel transport system ATP-binding protein n=1 Tax=Caballeronia udeis TaxID=1232866 RepID=A0ABW8MVW6_9BURK